MKQIFDWLREQIKEMKSAPKTESQWNYGWKTACHGFEHAINEAEAKWESEACEWKQTGLSEPPRYFEAHDLMAYELDICLWKYCPICGKPIKISEVE